tara:strand:- start:2920 stop:4152 length:1233 start_codon:yes stop_codon:yes gene_type:complete
MNKESLHLPAALENIRVIEWGSSVSAPFCGRLLGDLGADVIKIEPPEFGDNSRLSGPYPDQTPDPEQSGLFLFANLNKRGITIDLNQAKGFKLFNQLLATADVFIENQPYEQIKETGIDYQFLNNEYPHLVVTSITPYGRTGPYSQYKGNNLTVSALGGLSYGTGFPGREPLQTPLHQASYFAGVGAAFATIVALLGKDFTGLGQHVDIAESQVMGTLLTGYHLPTYIYRGIPGFRSGNRMRLGLFPNCVLPCKDGYICIDAPQLEQYQRFLTLLNNPEWTQEPRYRDRRAMSDQYPEEAENLIAPWFMDHTKDEILQLCLENRIPCVPVLTFDEVLTNQQLNSREFFQEIDHGENKSFRYPGFPYRLSASPPKLVRSAPSLGQHTHEVLCDELGVTDSEYSALFKAGVI